MSRAPSEKHLENWILTNPEQVYVQDEPYEPNWDGKGYLFHKVIDAQFNLPHGICDVVALSCYDHDLRLCAVELKKNAITSKDVAQCLRYIHDLREIFGYYLADHGRHRAYKPRGLFQSHYLGLGPEIGGILIGHGISDENLIYACESNHIKLFSYDYSPDCKSYEFDIIWHNNYVKTYDSISEASEIALSNAFDEILLDRMAQERRSS